MKNLSQKINWKKGQGLIPAIIQDQNTKAVLMLGFMNKAALARTLKSKKIWFYSRTKQRLWMKGESSGNILNLVNIKLDCDQDTLLITAEPKGPTCHNGTISCFSDSNTTDDLSVIQELYNVIKSRKEKMPNNSYTTSLFKEGINKICAKIEEESDEVIQAAKTETNNRLIEESVDLIYHLFVLLVEQKIDLIPILKEIKRRRR